MNQSDLAWVALATDDFASERALHILLKAVGVLAELRGRLVIERVVWVRLEEEEDKAHDHVSDVKHGLPVGSQNIQADVALHVNVRMVHVGVAVDDRGFVGVLRGHAHGEIELSANPDAVLLPGQVHCETELHNVGLVDTHCNKGGLVQVLHVLSQTDLAWGSARGSLGTTGRGLRFLFLHSSGCLWGLLLAEHVVYLLN